MTQISSAGADVRQALLDTARILASRGETGDTVLSRPAPILDTGLSAELRRLVCPPDTQVGYRAILGIFKDFGDPGPTPIHWRSVDTRRTSALDIGLVLVAALLGDVFAWISQQDGHIVHNILPSPGCEHLQVGASSVAPLAWHTEDAFHPARADFLLLACVRNPAGVGTRLSTINRAKLRPQDVMQLFSPHIVIVPDDSYGGLLAGKREQIAMSTLWYRAGGFGLRYDPAYSSILTDDSSFHHAYKNLGEALENCSVSIPLYPGDLLVIDNDVAVHGRVAFQAHYDGTDRWLKRVLVRAPRFRPVAESREHGFGQVVARHSR